MNSAASIEHAQEEATLQAFGRRPCLLACRAQLLTGSCRVIVVHIVGPELPWPMFVQGLIYQLVEPFRCDFHDRGSGGEEVLFVLLQTSIGRHHWN